MRRLVWLDANYPQSQESAARDSAQRLGKPLVFPMDDGSFGSWVAAATNYAEAELKKSLHTGAEAAVVEGVVAGTTQS